MNSCLFLQSDLHDICTELLPWQVSLELLHNEVLQGIAAGIGISTFYEHFHYILEFLILRINEGDTT